MKFIKTNGVQVTVDWWLSGWDLIQWGIFVRLQILHHVINTLMTLSTEQKTPCLSPCIISSIRSLMNHSNWKDSSLASPYKTPHTHQQAEQSLMLHLNSRWTGDQNLWMNETEMTQQKDEVGGVTRSKILICKHLFWGYIGSLDQLGML